MGKVSLGITMSLDGFIAGPKDDIQHLFKWYFSGSVEIPIQQGRMTLKVAPESAAVLDGAMKLNGAMLTGRRNFDVAHAWGGTPPFEPTVVLTHNPPPEWIKEGSPFIFVTDGIESAIRKAKEAAGDKDIAVATPSLMQQALKAGLLDEIHIDLVPVLLGQGTRLFEYLGIEPLELDIVEIVPAPGVTHMTYRVKK